MSLSPGLYRLFEIHRASSFNWSWIYKHVSATYSSLESIVKLLAWRLHSVLLFAFFKCIFPWNFFSFISNCEIVERKKKLYGDTRRGFFCGADNSYQQRTTLRIFLCRKKRVSRICLLLSVTLIRANHGAFSFIHDDFAVQPNHLVSVLSRVFF